MRFLLNNLVSVAFLLTLSSLSECIRIRRSGVAGYDDPYGLTNAFSEMDRPRRGDYRTMLRKRVLEDDDTYFNPSVGSRLGIDSMDYLGPSTYSDNLAGYLSDYDYQRPSYDTLERYPLPLSYGYGPQKRTAYKPRRVVPTLDELKSMFGEADVPMKRLAVKRQEPAAESEESMETAKTVKDKTELVKEWGKLIDAAEKLTENSVKTESIQEKSDAETDKNEIKTDLVEAISDSETDNAEDAQDLNDEDTEEEDSETAVASITEENQAQSKAKRASSMGDSSDYVLGLLKEISDLKQRLYAQEMLQDLQSRENDFLANALKYATMDQIHESDRFVANEYNDIAKATETEQLIQQLSEGLEDDESEEDEGTNSELEEFTEPETKRSGVDTYEGAQWLERPASDDVGIGALLEDEDGSNEDEDFDGSESPIDIPYVDDESEDAEEEADMETENQDDLKGQEFLLAKLISNLSPGTLERVVSDLEEAETGVCEPVMKLSQNCAFADAKGIPIDAEARSLCVRHQLCYTCGSALEISPDRCDGGYKGTVLAECGNDVKCVQAAAYFLHLMTSRFHKYEIYSPAQCSHQCVADFIYGV